MVSWIALEKSSRDLLKFYITSGLISKYTHVLTDTHKPRWAQNFFIIIFSLPSPI